MFTVIVKGILRLGALSLRNPIIACRRIFHLVLIVRKASKFYQSSYIRVIRRVLLLRKIDLPAQEASHIGLLNPDISGSESSKYVSKGRLKEIQKSINPTSWEFLTEDKSIFYRYCTSHGIPIPKLFAVFFKTTAGWSFNGAALENKDDWYRFFDKDIPSEFVIKPSRGVYGKGINIFGKTNKGLSDPFGKSYKTEDIYEIMHSDPKYNCFVIQERLKNHPELVRLTNIQFLQTTRIVTLFDTNGECQLLFAFFKPIVGQNVKDNFEWGRTGNLKAEVFLDTGILTSVQAMMPNKLGMKPVSAHPRTGVPFEGFQLPFWKEARLLVKDIAHKFLPIKTIGWDVALTPTGPYIVEGNMWWDPSHLHEVTDVHVVSVITGN